MAQAAFIKADEARLALERDRAQDAEETQRLSDRYIVVVGERDKAIDLLDIARDVTKALESRLAESIAVGADTLVGLEHAEQYIETLSEHADARPYQRA